MKKIFAFSALLALGMVFSQCKKDNNNNNNNCSGDVFFSGELDGESLCYFVKWSTSGGGIGGVTTGNNHIDMTNNICTNSYGASAGLLNSNLDQIAGIDITFDSYYTWPCDVGADEAATMAAAFVTGSHSYLSAPAPQKGVIVEYFGEDGVYWSTENGSQAGSTFTITNVEATTADFNFTQTAYILKGNFKCKVYNTAGTSSKLLDISNFQLQVEGYE